MSTPGRMQSLCFSIINPLWGEGEGGWDLKLQLLASHCAPAGHVNLSIHLYLNNLYTFRLTEPAKPSKRKFTPVISSSFCQGRHLKVWKRKPQWVTHPFPLTWKSWVDLLLLTLWYYMLEITYYCMPGPFFHSIYDIYYAFDFLFLIWRLLKSHFILNFLQLKHLVKAHFPAGVLAE